MTERHRAIVWLLRLAPVAAVLLLAGAPAYLAFLKHAAASRGASARWVLREVGPAFVEAIASNPKHAGLVDGRTLADFATARSETARGNARTLRLLVPVPLIPSDQLSSVVAWPQNGETLQQPLLPYDPTMDQVLLFVVERAKPYGHAYAYLTSRNERSFSASGIRFSERQAMPPHRNGMEFFDLAERMWTAAQSGDRAEFDAAVGSFRDSDTFYFGRPGDQRYLFSGRQLREMARVLTPVVMHSSSETFSSESLVMMPRLAAPCPATIRECMPSVEPLGAH